MTGRVYAIATLDTKGAELDYVRQCLTAAGAPVTTVDVGSGGPPTIAADVPRERLNADAAELSSGDRGRAIAAMSRALTAFLQAEHAAGRVAGVIGLGGSGGTALISAALRALPIGLPKLLVSTVASGNTAPYVDCSDITLMYSVVDVAGLNAVSRRVLANAAHAMAGMVLNRPPEGESRPAIGMTMFGVTTPCVTRVRETLEKLGFDCLVFHATGAGGRAMEALVDSGLIEGVLDITTTEVADELVGGVFACGPQRFEKLLQREIPLVLSLGALDMVNFGALDTVPPQFRNRKLHVHNANVTLMRTTADENRRFGAWIADKLNRSTAPLRMLIPEGGVSLIDVPGQPFHDPQADAALFDELAHQLKATDQRRLIRLPYAINAPEFADALVQQFIEVCGERIRGRTANERK
jgi:uncharacterized protein (UPF0261 family)